MLHIPEQYEQITLGRTDIIVHGRYRDRLLEAGIDAPDRLLAGAARTASASGRGAVPALPVPGCPGQRMMVRRYLRGGLIRFFNKELYSDRLRAFRELATTVHAARSGIPTVEILAAVTVKTGSWYRHFLFSRELAGCIDLPAYLCGRAAGASFFAEKRSALEAAACLVRRMHEAGFYHGDLNLKNILVCAAQPDLLYIIDWDKSYCPGVLADDLRKENAVRFCRSMLKLAQAGLPADPEDAEAFLRAYCSDSDFVRACREQLQRTVARRRAFWRLSG